MNTDIEELVQYFANTTWKLVGRLDQYAIRGTHNSKNIPTLSFSALQGRTASWLVSQAYQPPVGLRQNHWQRSTPSLQYRYGMVRLLLLNARSNPIDFMKTFYTNDKI